MMSYQSLTFILFCLAVLVLYYIVGRKGQPWVLALANAFFYLQAGPEYLPFLLVTMAVTFFAGLMMRKVYQKADIKLSKCKDAPGKKAIRAQAKKQAKVYLILSVLIPVAILAVCKYTGFLVNTLSDILVSSGKEPLEVPDILLPMGISFYTFMALSYVLDVFWKRYEAETNFLTYAVYLSYFPHVVQGPIDRFNEFKAQLSEGVKFSYENVTQGAQLVLWGFFKKLVIADRLGLFVNKVFSSWQEFDGIILILAVVVYSIQIYADFSGCIDIVTGVSEMLGIRLRKNFNHPYFSKTMGEFWRRWHISLQEWFKDYIYFPVSASNLIRKVKKLCKNTPKLAETFTACFPILVVWLITGIWHGAAWRFVVWGLFHAAVLILSHIFTPLLQKATSALKIRTENFGYRFLQMVRTFLICCAGRVFFRASDVDTAFAMFHKIFSDTNFSALFKKEIDYGISFKNMNVALVSVLVLWIVDILQERMPIRKTLSDQNLLFRWMIILLGILAVVIFGMYGPGFDGASFIYEQF